jgi:DnaJ-class molecular chaperone
VKTNKKAKEIREASIEMLIQTHDCKKCDGSGKDSNKEDCVNCMGSGAVIDNRIGDIIKEFAPNEPRIKMAETIGAIYGAIADKVGDAFERGYTQGMEDERETKKS